MYRKIMIIIWRKIYWFSCFYTFRHQSTISTQLSICSPTNYQPTAFRIQTCRLRSTRSNCWLLYRPFCWRFSPATKLWTTCQPRNQTMLLLSSEHIYNYEKDADPAQYYLVADETGTTTIVSIMQCGAWQKMKLNTKVWPTYLSWQTESHSCFQAIPLCMNADYLLKFVRTVNSNKCCQSRLRQGTSAFSTHVLSRTDKEHLPELFTNQLH
jgi:hypothetical protein